MDFPVTEYFKLANSTLGAPPRSSVAPALGVAALAGGATLTGLMAADGRIPGVPVFSEDAAAQQYFDKLDRMPTFKPEPPEFY